MTQCILKITLGNDAMSTGSDIARALIEVSRRIKKYGYSLQDMKNGGFKVMDLNGNSTGNFEVI